MWGSSPADGGTFRPPPVSSALNRKNSNCDCIDQAHDRFANIQCETPATGRANLGLFVCDARNAALSAAGIRVSAHSAFRAWQSIRPMQPELSNRLNQKPLVEGRAEKDKWKFCEQAAEIVIYFVSTAVHLEVYIENSVNMRRSGMNQNIRSNQLVKHGRALANYNP